MSNEARTSDSDNERGMWYGGGLGTWTMNSNDGDGFGQLNNINKRNLVTRYNLMSYIIFFSPN